MKTTALLFALLLPALASAAPADRALRILSGRCADDGRALPARLRHVFTAGPERFTAVQALAGALGATVERVAVPEVLPGTDKYIGETEKNLNRLEVPATEQAAVLYFDEADALFTGRGPAVDALLARLDRLARNRVVILGLRDRPFGGRLGQRALAVLPNAGIPPWAAVCGAAE